MAEPTRDKWAEWVLRGGHKGDLSHTSESEFLRSVRDQVLKNANMSGGETLLDVGAGDGLVAFGALDLLGNGGRVIFSDISEELLDHCRSLAAGMGVARRCRFVRAPAEDLSAVGNSSVDVVAMRSVLIYVAEKRRAFEEFRRVLRPGGRLSIFEPINSFTYPEPPGVFLGYDVTTVWDLARKLRDIYERIQPPGTDPMTNFDERDLLALAEEAGFAEVRLDYRVEIVPGNLPGMDTQCWEKFVASAGNPTIPTVGEAIEEALTPEEAKRFAAHLRPLVEGAHRQSRLASAYLWAVK